MNAFDLLLIGAFGGLLLGVTLLNGRRELPPTLVLEERRSGGCAELFVALLVVGLIVLALSSV